MCEEREMKRESVRERPRDRQIDRHYYMPGICKDSQASTRTQTGGHYSQ